MLASPHVLISTKNSGIVHVPVLEFLFSLAGYCMAVLWDGTRGYGFVFIATVALLYALFHLRLVRVNDDKFVIRSLLREVSLDKESVDLTIREVKNASSRSRRIFVDASTAGRQYPLAFAFSNSQAEMIRARFRTELFDGRLSRGL